MPTGSELGANPYTVRSYVLERAGRGILYGESLYESWITVTLDPPLCGRTNTTENITFHRLCWWAVTMVLEDQTHRIGLCLFPKK